MTKVWFLDDVKLNGGIFFNNREIGLENNMVFFFILEERGVKEYVIFFDL